MAIVMRKIYFLLLFVLVFSQSYAFKLSGHITDADKKPVSFSSILIKGTTVGTTTNQQGFYTLQLNPGTYTIVCQHVGFKSVEQKVVIKDADVVLDFQLLTQQYKLEDVVIKAGAEDPAYAIIRNAIKKRPFYDTEVKKFECDVYIKGQMRLRDYPDKFMGVKVEFDGGSHDEYLGNDSSKKKIIFLSETMARYAVQEPDRKVEVTSTRVSGRSDGYGFSSPQIASFYKNVISIGRNLNPRGFISPIANNALNYYRYKFEGTFYENGKEISRIKVIPKRKYEPLFSGYINIIENEWRIHSLQLQLVKEQQMQYLDTLKIEQIYMPAGKVWLVKQQVINIAIKIFGFDAYGNFVQVYDKYNLDPKFPKGYFDNTVLKFLDSSNKKTKAYWDTVRPLALQPEEIADYKKKDSIEIVKQSPEYLDSVDKKRNKPNVMQLLLTGQSFSKSKKKITVSFDPMLDVLTYNTVEGGVVNLAPTIFKSYDNNRWFSFTPQLRYGFSNKHFNASATAIWRLPTKRNSRITVSGGSRVFQFNNAQPITPRANTFATLLWNENLMKIYEASFGKLAYSAALSKGFTFRIAAEYQHRLPLENTSFATWRKNSKTQFTPNYPVEISNQNIPEHKAFLATLSLSWQPGARYIEFPDRIINIGSKYPNFNLSITQAVNNFLGSNADYTRWRFSMNDNLNFKIGGSLNYNIGVGGFLNDKSVFLPDYAHFNGNIGFVASEYLNSFQLASLYQLSNKERFYRYGHVEYHLNGLISNKIPGFKKLNWFFVIGGNGININQQFWHYEAFFSIENILKVLRVDFITAIETNGVNMNGFRISLPGLLQGNKED